jgi:hypothetical protein
MSFYSSRSQPHKTDANDETYTTIEIYVNSQNGTIPLAGYSDINSGFTVQLANPIILDIDHRYVIALIKSSIDITEYTDGYYTFDINTDLIEYQYEDNQKKQLLYQTYDYKYVPESTTAISPQFSDVLNVNWKFINPTQKIISRISFWITDSTTGVPLKTPAVGSYPTKLDVLIKKVNTRVVATTIL